MMGIPDLSKITAQMEQGFAGMTEMSDLLKQVLAELRRTNELLTQIRDKG